MRGSILFIFGLVATLAAGKSYNNYKLVRTSPLNFEQASKLQKLEDVYDFWRPARSGLSTDIMVGPQEQNYLYNLLENLGIEFVEIIKDIGD